MRGPSSIQASFFLILSLNSAASSLAEERKDAPPQFLEILAQIQTTPTGKKLIESALAARELKDAQELASIFAWGRISKTDATVKRILDPLTYEERREKTLQISIRRDELPEEILLDAAHELVHATFRPDWDPYQPDWTAAKYIHFSIEGDGGEVQAVQTECQIATELLELKTIKTLPDRCKLYWGKNGIEKERVIREFYKLGRWQTELNRFLGEEVSTLPFLAAEEPAFYSSTGDAPYPIALYREFEALTEIACKNSQNRILILQPSVEAGNEAAEPLVAFAARFVSKRCSSRRG